MPEGSFERGLSMPYDPRKHHRRSIRLAGYDYTQAGNYHVTIVTHDREQLLGSICNGVMELSEYGVIVSQTWHALAERYTFLSIDTCVVMPDHVHVLLALQPGAVRNPTQTSTSGRPHGTTCASLGAVVQSAKSVAARRVNRLRGTQGAPVWQRNYYERIIRDAEHLQRTRSYVAANPERWPE
jgi:putative transposase